MYSISKRTSIKSLTFSLLLILLHGGTATAQQTLRIANGDVIEGKLDSIANSTIRWTTPFFHENLQLPIENCNEIEFLDIKPSTPSKFTFQIRMTTGDLLTTNIDKVTNSIVYASSPRHGRIELPIEQVATIERYSPQKAVINGFSTFNDSWQSFRDGKLAWQTTAGSLKTETEYANLYFPTEQLPENLEIRIEFKFRHAPDFSFGLVVPRTLEDQTAIPRIETWDGTLVMANGEDDFEILIEEIPAGLDEIALNIKWNRKTNAITIADALGQNLVETTISIPNEKSKPGFFLRNLTGDLSMTQFVVVPASFGRPVEVGEAKSKEGKVLSVKEVAFDGNEWKFGTGSLVNEKFHTARLAKPSPDSTEDSTAVRYQDGSVIQGELQASDNERLLLTTRFAKEPLTCSLAGVYQIQVGKTWKTSQPTYTHVLQTGNRALHGELVVAANQQGRFFHWMQSDATNSVSIASRDSIRISRVRSKTPSLNSSTPVGLVDTMHLKNGDVIYCKTVSIIGTSIKIQTETGEYQVESTNVSAIDFGREKTGRLRFLDQESRDEALLIPRNKRLAPPKNLIASTTGDYLRGNVDRLEDGRVDVSIGARRYKFEKEKLSTITWLHDILDPEENSDSKAAPEKKAIRAKQEPTNRIRVITNNNQRITCVPKEFVDHLLRSNSDAWGTFDLDARSIKSLTFNPSADLETGDNSDAPRAAYADWQASFAKPAHLKSVGNSPPTESELIRKPAPDFAAAFSIDEKPFKLSDYQGQIIVLDFWATWCGYCVSAMPKVMQEVSEFEAEGVVLFGVNEGESPEQINAFVKRREWNLNVLLDQTTAIGMLYEVDGLPHTIVIDRDGTIAAVFIGAGHDLAPTLRKLTSNW